MSMPVMALFTRALRQEARLVRTYLIRVGLLVFVLFAVMSAQAQAAFVGAPGLMFFGSLVMINFFFITFVGLGLFASAITEEKEEMTLGLLRMTSLSPLAILFGKSTSRLLSAALLLAGQFPFTILAVTLGGVSMTQILAAYCTLLAYIVFLANVALFCSVICRRTANAGGFTGFIILAFFCAPSLGKMSLDGLVWLNVISAASLLYGLFSGLFLLMGRASPFDKLIRIMRTGFSEPAIDFQVISNILLGVVFFLLAWALFDLCTRQQKQAAPARALLVKRTSRLRILGAGRAWRCALAWKDFFFLSGGVVAAAIKFLAIGLAVGISFYIAWTVEGGRVDLEFAGGTAMIVSLITLGIELVACGTRIFHEELKWKTLPSIMVLPFSPGELAYRKLLGCAPALIPHLAVFAIGVCLAPGPFFETLGEMLTEMWGVVFVVTIVLFLHVLVYFSLIVKRWALLLTIGVFWIGGMIFGTIISILSMMMISFGGGQDPIAVFTIMLFTALTIWIHFAIGWRLRKEAGA